ncbi:hypothetical protein BDZ94DRAFT_267077 [Collybia nuda]|uniref:Uncharacterized protein n=1 Tax=Collybia nuda TaxID=64659 RepID=A0A9P5XUL1_9AGAR|nr:hypothetical protein BDZ94DRAFT_267077 [Collybia nuda]
MRPSILLTLVSFIAISGVATSSLAEAVCAGQTTLSETYIGENKNVKVEFATCPDVVSSSFKQRDVLEARQTNVCATTCQRNCFLPAGGGPDPNECHVIADALKFESQNTGPFFQIGTGTNNTIVMTYSSCKTFFVNQDFGDLVYCRTNWSSTIDNLAFNCQSTQNAHGGNCVATDQRWFIQVQNRDA